MTSATPLVIRCVNSIIVCAFAFVPRTLPPQAGHLFPQPAPDPVARTKAPQSTTATLTHSVAQAKRATLDIFLPENLIERKRTHSRSAAVSLIQKPSGTAGGDALARASRRLPSSR